MSRSFAAVRVVIGILLVGTLLGSATAGAYSVQAGDILVRPVVGASVNVLRFPAATRATPQGGLLLGVDVDYVLDGPFALAAALRPVVSPNYVDGNLGVGVKYRLVQLNAPFLPYGAFMVTTALGGPLGAGALHVNLGGRLAGGVDYFVMRDLAVGLEMAAEASGLLIPALQPEASTEVLAGVTWRF